MKQVTIVGGGVIGLCCAYYLQKEGYGITIIEKNDITDGTSFGNAGYISPSHFVPLATPGIVAQGLRWMLSSTSPFYIKPRFSWDLVKWLTTFWKQANAQTVERHIPPLNDILHLSRALTTDIKNDLGNRFRMEEIGCFMLYKTPAVEKHEIELAQQAALLNIDTKVLNAQEVQAMEPNVQVDVRGGVLYPIDCHLHPGDFMRALKEHLQKAGVKLQLNTTVTGFEKKGHTVTAVLTDKGKFECSHLVLANGSWLPVTGKLLGLNILLQAGKGYSMTYEHIERNLRYPAILVDKRVAMTPMGADLRMGGTMEISGLNSPMLYKRAQAIYNGAKAYYPDLPVQPLPPEKVWYGLRPLTPDGLPYIGGHSQYNNLLIAGGHAMLGISLAAGTGKLIEELIGKKKTSINVEAFRPERF
jgi:D-amino-acid dehydrogenase